VAVAKEILAEGGYGDDAEIPVLKKMVRDDPASRQIFAIQQRQAAAAGIRVEGVFVGWNEQLKSIQDGTAQIWDISWLADWPAAQNFLQLFYGPSAPDPNACRYANPAFDDLYLAARLLPPGPERTDYFRELQDIVTQDCPWRFRFRRVQYTATHPWVHGYRHHEFVERWLKYCRVDAAERRRRKSETR